MQDGGEKRLRTYFVVRRRYKRVRWMAAGAGILVAVLAIAMALTILEAINLARTGDLSRRCPAASGGGNGALADRRGFMVVGTVATFWDLAIDRAGAVLRGGPFLMTYVSAATRKMAQCWAQ